MFIKITSFLLLYLGLGHASITIGPSRVDIFNKKKVSTLVVENNSKDAVFFQLKVVRLGVNKQGSEVEESDATSDIGIFPDMLKLRGGQAKKVQIFLRDETDTQVEKTYRLCLNQINSKVYKKGLCFIFNFKVPIYVKPYKAIDFVPPVCSIKNRMITCQNPNWEHIIIRSINTESDEGKESVYAKGAVILSGGTKTISLTQTEVVQKGPLSLNITHRGKPFKISVQKITSDAKAFPIGELSNRKIPGNR